MALRSCVRPHGGVAAGVQLPHHAGGQQLRLRRPTRLAVLPPPQLVAAPVLSPPAELVAPLQHGQRVAAQLQSPSLLAELAAGGNETDRTIIDPEATRTLQERVRERVREMMQRIAELLAGRGSGRSGGNADTSE